jgi:hypothetical protein
MKNLSDPIGVRKRDLLTCSAVPEPAAPPRIPRQHYTSFKNMCSLGPFYKGGGTLHGAGAIFLPTSLSPYPVI